MLRDWDVVSFDGLAHGVSLDLSQWNSNGYDVTVTVGADAGAGASMGADCCLCKWSRGCLWFWIRRYDYRRHSWSQHSSMVVKVVMWFLVEMVRT